MSQVPNAFLKEKEEMLRLKNRINFTSPQKVKSEDLVKLSHHYYHMFQVSDNDRSKSLCIGQAGYYGSWAVGKGHTNLADIKKFIKYLKIDLTMPNPDDTAKEHLKTLQEKLKVLLNK